MTNAPPIHLTAPDATTFTFGSWNINARSGNVVAQHLQLLRRTGVDVVALQEVTESYYRALVRVVGERNVAYSLAIEPPKPDAPKNRRLGCAVAVLNPEFVIRKAHLLQTAVCQERTIIATLSLDGLTAQVGSFHSPNGSNWGSNKALWLNDITNWVNQQTEPTLFGIDANTPRQAELPDTDPKKWWREDSHPNVGNAARRLVGDDPSHNMRDAWKVVNPNAVSTPVSYSRDNRGADRAELACRYDFIYTSHHFRPTACHYHYDEVVQAPTPLSDHALVVAQLQFPQHLRVAPELTKEVVTMPRTAITPISSSQPSRHQPTAGSVPDAAAYEAAFRELLGGGNNSYRKMLDAHLRAPGHAITPHELAQVAGYANHRAVNLQYGTLGARLGNLLGYRPTKLSLQGKECNTFTFADWQAGKWVLNRDAAAALTKLGLGQ